MLKVTILGSGSWGTALAQHLAKNGVFVKLWGRDQGQVETILQTRENAGYLSGVRLSENIYPLTSLEDAVFETSAIVACLPSSQTRVVLENCKAIIQGASRRIPIISTAKGLEIHTNKRVSQIIDETLGRDYPHFVLSGPSFALEVAKGLPTAVVLASNNDLVKEEYDFSSRLFHRGAMRVYTSSDLVGVELGGILKNVIAIACGISDGLQLGLNARAALLTRGLKELVKLIEAEGGNKDSVAGLSGLGDLILTATGDLSRNRTFGILLGQGLTIDQAREKIGKTIEAFTTAQSALELAQKRNIEVPIIEQVADILSGKTTPIKALQDLMTREQKSE